MTEHVETCEWFLWCDGISAGTVNHPVIGPVPVCAKCAARLGLVFDEEEGA